MIARPQPTYATDAEVTAAIHALTDVQLDVLEASAQFRARSLAALGIGVGASDLLQEALARTVAGKRRWSTTVAFVTHVKATMRSIAGHYRDEVEEPETGGDAAEGAATPAQEANKLRARRYKVESLAEGADEPHLLSVAARLSSAEAVLMARTELARIRELFKNDQRVLDVMDGLAEQLKGPEIQEILEITAQQYESIVKRMRETLLRNGFQFQ